MSGEKTEEPTPKKLREARERGEVPRSKELSSAAVLLAAGAALAASAEGALVNVRGCMDASFSAVSGQVLTSPLRPLELCASLGLSAMLPVLLAAMLAGTTVTFLQVGPLLTLKALKPQPRRIDPIQGTKQLFTQRRLIELLKSLLMLLIVGYVVQGVLASRLGGLVGLVGRDARATMTAAGDLVTTLIFRVGGATVAIGVLDFFYQRWRHKKDQRMTKDEVKREFKDAEGDPQHKAERQRLHQELIEHGVLEEVRGADVLVVNPTHIAVALRYDEEADEAPQVRAKGQDGLAQRMIRAAEEAGVPVVRDVPLARALYELQEGEEIPEELYEAVAAVLHAAWQQREHEEAGGPSPEGGIG